MRCDAPVPRLARWVRALAVATVALLLASPALAEKGKLRERLTPEVMKVVFPAGADRLGPEEGSPPAIAVYQGDSVAAYVFSTLDIVAAPGYSTTPFDVIAGVDLTGRITGAKVVFHNEPYIIHDVGRQRLLDTFLAREAGRPLRGATNILPPDFVAGATISSRAMRAAVSITAGLVLRARAARPAAPVAANGPAAGPANAAQAPAAAAPALDVDSFSRKSWDALIAAGAVVRRRITAGDVAAALAEKGAAGAKLDVPISRSESLYVEIATALFTPAAIGGNLVGVLNHEDYKRKMPADAQAIFVASKGPYDFRGKKFFLDSEGRRFDRLRVVQDDKTFTFVQDDYQWVNPATGNMRGMDDAGLFVLPASSGFDPLKEWRLELLVNADNGTPVTVAFDLDYKVPDLAALSADDPNSGGTPPAPAVIPGQATVGGGQGSAPRPVETAALPAAPSAVPATPGEAPWADDLNDAPAPAWVEAWHDSRLNVAILTVLLSVLTLIFVFQVQLSRHRLAHRLVRNGFLLVVLVWLGWTAGVQLSIVNVMNYLRAPFLNLDWSIYLAEPLMVIVAGYTLISLVLIGRGVFCGWLCPFGAMQELLGQASRALGLPQWNPSEALEKRLWLGKYIAAAVVLVLVMSEIDPSGATTEIEPFKTAITSKFTRAWPFVLYAGTLLAIGLFSERAYCRFLCPLGGVLAALDRLHLLNLLKRRPECGNPCHLCERSCPVRAIEKTGKIITAECFQCLDCQVEYYDDKRCPPLVQAAKLRGARRPAAAAVQSA